MLPIQRFSYSFTMLWLKAEIISPQYLLDARPQRGRLSTYTFAVSKDLGLIASLGHKCQNGNRKDGVKDGRLIHVTITNL